MFDAIRNNNPDFHATFGEVSKDDVFASVDVAKLYEMHRGLYDLFDAIQSKIEAYTTAGIADRDWVGRAAGKVAYSKMAIRWVERRLAELNADIPPTREGKDKATIRRLKSELSEAKALIRSMEAV